MSNFPCSLNAFQVFQLSPSMNLDQEELERRYHLLQQLVNPDANLWRSPYEQKLSAEKAMEINAAYQALRDPLSRAREFLLAHGHSIPGKEGETIQSPEILSEVIDWREKMDQALEEGNVDTFLKKLELAVKSQADILEKEVSQTSYLRYIYLTKTLHHFQNFL